MQIRTLSPDLSICDQPRPEDMARIASLGFRAVIGNRPDGEEAGQPTWDELAAAAAQAGLAARHLPIGGQVSAADQAEAFARALGEMPGPVLAWCRSGNRAEQVARLALGFRHERHHRVVVVGGGSAGIATTASLLKRRKGLDIAVVEPREEHYYQPGWTMVGGGVFKPRDTVRPTGKIMPKGAHWIHAGCIGFDPDRKAILLDDGTRLTYEVLIVAMGNRLAWEAVDGLEAALGQFGVTSNYRYDLAPYTWELVRATRGGRALFTQPPMPIKCAGAPQKAMYLSCSEWRRSGALGGIEVEFHNAGTALFGVADYVPALMEAVQGYGIDLRFGSNLVAVDGPAREATFHTADGEVTRRFDMLHAVPPQAANAIVAASPLADAGGYAQVDPATLRHVRYPEIFALGDGCNTANAKTAAAARKQAPVVAVNALAVLDGEAPPAGYDGYGSCPLTVDRGHIVLAEFAYGGKLAPTLPTWLIEGKRPSRLAWHLKADALPAIYWHGMLKGREWLVQPVPLQ